ncbi:hypothetical protein SORBI_3001G408001 [Sorghum bicolor]|uniref:Phosphoinositide phospholipase C n=1 Tax=Sorghum bicolor TaxID=4558 RepID=A0A1Z5SA06_SORBI|nr:hypothetical protein SORBI_3001G408001 [Sorghum bicolor]
MPKRDKAASPRASPPHTPPPGTDSEAEEADQAGASAAEMGTYKCCIFFTRRFALADTSTPEDVRALFSRYAGGSPYMLADDLRRYLAAWGGADGEVPEQIIDRILQDRSRTPRFGRPALTVDDFLHFLFSEDLNPPLRHSKVNQDMNAPLSHYFIYTGHNSYLTGNQLSSDCSDVPIIKALQIGVRVIELDIWPNSSKDDIDVLHGRTLTAPVSLIKCLRSIKEYAFVASPYPVIITLEDHLTPDLQAKVAKMVLEVFGDILYYPESKHLQEFPSPEALKGRVMLSTKPPKEYLEAKGGTMKEREIEAQFKKGEREEAAWGVEVPDIHEEMQVANRNDDDLLYRERGADGDDEKKTKHVAAEYKHLITIKAGKPKGPLVDALKNDPDKVGIAGVPLDSVMRKTKAVEDSWVPVWEEEFTFPLTVPEIAVLRVEVHEQDVSEDDFGGQTALPVAELRPGIRAVPLFDHKGLKFRSVKLLMCFEFA